MSHKCPALLIFCYLMFAVPVYAEAPEGLEELPAPLPPPEQVEHDPELEPEVTIIQREDEIVSEYRLNGVLYMVKITPNVGKPYYFLDRDGDGVMESKMSNLYNDFKVPQWVIFSW